MTEGRPEWSYRMPCIVDTVHDTIPISGLVFGELYQRSDSIWGTFGGRNGEIRLRQARETSCFRESD